MSLRLGELRVGKVDGKHEYLQPLTDRDHIAFDAFLIPESVQPERMNNGDVVFIEGFRGTGKTSLLRWHAEQQQKEGAVTDFVLFKTDLTEAQRLHISKEVGISWTDVEPSKMELSQDFKDAWTWFILHKIGENIRSCDDLVDDSTGLGGKATRLLGLHDDSIFVKAIGFMPKLDGASIKIKADLPFFEAELGGDFSKSGSHGQTTLNALNQKILKNLASIKFKRPFYLYFDELEAFYHSPEQHKRDLRMVRDLIFAVGSINDMFRKSRSAVNVLAAVRSEVIDAMGSLGQEVDRLVHDRGFLISWHHANRSLHHPLIQIIKGKITASERAAGVEPCDDPIQVYFPAKVNDFTVEQFLLDRSFYKPRDIVWRLSIAQKLFPNQAKFTVDVLHETETEYSAKLWEEVRYELSATYSDDEIDAVESVISGGPDAFELSQIQLQFEHSARHSIVLVDLLKRKSVREILSDLYRLGAVGNSYRMGTTGSVVQNRWAFRGDTSLLAERRMVIHPALLKRLSVVSKRRRGTRGARERDQNTR